MIDEPELNLHPTRQRQLARLLVQLVNSGLHVVISTHSDYIIRELNIQILLNQKGGEVLRKRYRYLENEVLDPALVGAYLFDRDTIEEFRITPEDGIYASTFDDVINDMNAKYSDIYYTLKYGEKASLDD